MSLGVTARRFRRQSNSPQTTIDGLPVVATLGSIWWVDGTNGSNSNSGKTPSSAFASITTALTKVDQHDIVYVMAKEMAQTDTDPGSYAETFTVSVPQVSIIGVGHREQGGLPQVKIGSGTTAMCTIAAPGVLIANLGFNGASSTGGGIKFVDDGGSTYASFGGRVENCHFKNCKLHATNGSLGGGITISGAPWQCSFIGNQFYNNVGGIVLIDTSNSVPQDLHIEGNFFGGAAASVDVDIDLSGGSGAGTGLVIKDNVFTVQPAISSGTLNLYMDLTGCDSGILAGNYFGTDGTLGAAGNAALVPTTVFLSGNYDEGGLIGRT